MQRYGAWLALSVALLLVASVAGAEDGKDQPEEMEHYPIAWASIDAKPIIDNDRLFKKYKECILTERSMGCPRDILALKKILPEAFETNCAKCLPEHIKAIKEITEYICTKRRADYDEAIQLKDPTGQTRARFYAKYGAINC